MSYKGCATGGGVYTKKNISGSHAHIFHPVSTLRSSVYDHFVTTLSKNWLNFRFHFVWGLFFSSRALWEGPVKNYFWVREIPLWMLCLCTATAVCYGWSSGWGWSCGWGCTVMPHSFSRSRCWATSLSAGDWGFKNPARGSLARLFWFSPSKPLKIINLSLWSQFGEASKN